MAISREEERLLDRDYMAWRAKEIQAGRIAKPPVPPYVHSKKDVPPTVESSRRTLGKSLQELEEEMLQFKAARASGAKINSQRLVDVHREIERLRTQEADIAWSLGEQAAYEDFVRGPERSIGTKPERVATERVATKRAGGLLGKIAQHKKLIAGGAALAGLGLVGLSFSGRDDAYNTIPGLHPGSEGMGAHYLRKHSDFGSGFISKFWEVYKDKAAKEGYAYYEGYKSDERVRAEKNLERFAAKKENILKFPAMGNSDTMAGRVRGQLTEFKEDFASRWDPLRKIAKDIFKGTDDEAFKQLTCSKEFREAIATGMRAPGKRIGVGMQGEVWVHKAQMALGGQTHEFEFVVKKGLPGAAGETASNALVRQTILEATLKTERGALEKLGHDRAPSFYGHARDFGLGEEAIIMERFELGRAIETNPLSQSEVASLESFMKSAHKQGITHTDLHDKNVVRAINNATGQEEIAVLDWGLANRFQDVDDIGGMEKFVRFNEGGRALAKRFQEITGQELDMRRFSEVADIMRVREHAKPPAQQDRSAKLAINSIYLHNNASRAASEAAKELNNVQMDFYAKQAHIDSAKVELLVKQDRKARTLALVDEVADRVASEMNLKQADPMEFDLLGALGNAGSLETGASQKLASLGATIPGKMTPRPAEAAGTVVSNKARQAAAKRNKKFQEMSKRSVGIGLRSSAQATKGHTNFGSTTSF